MTVIFLFIYLVIYIVSSRENFFVGQEQEVIERIVNSGMKEGKIPGISICVIRGENQYITTSGWADIYHKIPVTEETLFEIGSNTKAFTAYAIYQLEEEGLLGIDDYVDHTLENKEYL